MVLAALIVAPSGLAFTFNRRMTVCKQCNSQVFIAAVLLRATRDIFTRLCNNEIDGQGVFVRLALGYFLDCPLSHLEEPDRAIYRRINTLAKTIVMADKWTIPNLLWLADVINEWRAVVLKLTGNLCRFDFAIRKLVTIWSKSFLPRIICRPCYPGQLTSLTYTGQVMTECALLTERIVTVIPNVDHISRIEWLNTAGNFTAQLTNNSIHFISDLRDLHLLRENPKLLLENLVRVVHVCGFRSVLRGYCSRVTLPGSAPCSLLRARDKDHLLSFIETLQREVHFVCTYQSEFVMELCTSSLLKPSRRKKFSSFACERQQDFMDDFALTCFIGDATPSVKLAKGRIFPLDYP